MVKPAIGIRVVQVMASWVVMEQRGIYRQDKRDRKLVDLERRLVGVFRSEGEAERAARSQALDLAGSEEDG